jgi:hypothetical protein
MEFAESVYQPMRPAAQCGPTLRRRILHWYRRSMWLDAPPSDLALVPPLNVARRSAVGFCTDTDAPPSDFALASMTNIPQRRDHSERSARGLGGLGRLVGIRKYTGLGKMMAETPFLRIAAWGKIPTNLYIIRSTSFDLRGDKTYRDGNETREIDPI